MSFDRLKRPFDRSLGHKLKPSRCCHSLVQNSKPHLSMKLSYFLGIDAAKHKIRAALSHGQERLLFEKDLPVKASGLAELLVQLKRLVPEKEQLLILIEATGVLHLNWAAALTKAGYAVVVVNPLIARRLYHPGNALRDSKTDPIDARSLCQVAARNGAQLLELYRFHLRPAQLRLQRLHTVRKALRRSLTNQKKTYKSLLDLSFPELEHLLQVDAVGIRQLLLQAPTPAAIARMRRSTIEKNWMLRPKAAALKTLAAQSIADPDIAQASAPALCSILELIATLEKRLMELDQQIAQLTRETLDPQNLDLLQSIPGFGPLTAAKVLAFLPTEILRSGNNRNAAARLQAFMGNDPRLKESGQWKGHTKMSKRGVEMLRSAFFQCAFSAAQHDPELRAFYLRKRAQGKHHEVAISHLMRILTRRAVAVLRS
ncbi:MAG TPA: IS110 family transposase, partial [Scandinavium sp.]|uniref:IS110 family transposase n=1 Tax=Scandinavium sp. TaxID=2830653 RepID=UPI002E2FC5A5